MKSILLCVMTVMLLGACIGPKRYVSYVDREFKSNDTITTAISPGIRLNTEPLKQFEPMAIAKKGSTYFIPAIFYWGVKETFHCYLNPKIPVTIFSNTCRKFADSFNIINRLHGQTLELTINSLPSRFVYSNTQDVIFALVFGYAISRQSVIPEADDLSITYKVYNGGTVMRIGNVTVRNTDHPIKNNLKSTRKITREYINQYYRNMTRLSQQCMIKLAGEI